MKFPFLFALASVLCSTSATLHASHQGGKPPTLTASLTGETILRTGDELAFTLTVQEPDGDPVELVCLNPPNELRFDPLAGAIAPATVPVCLRTGRGRSEQLGNFTLFFEARDDDGSTRLALPFLVLADAFAFANVSKSQVADVTGDGELDLVVLATTADIGGTFNAGAAYVWEGSATPDGAPTASLTVPGATSSDGLGTVGGDGLLIADVSGDGVDDIVIATTVADLNGEFSAGALYLWLGGGELSGNVRPAAFLSAPVPHFFGRLPSVDGQPYFLADVTGDGVRDVIAGSAFYGIRAVQSGVIYVWEGGPSLLGAKAPHAQLAPPNPNGVDNLGGNGTAREQRLWVGDPNDDGILDVIAACPGYEGGGVSNSGAIFYWRGGAQLAGTPAPNATLTIPGGGATGDALGSLHIADLTGDGIDDVIGGSPFIDSGPLGIPDLGAFYLWKGRTDFFGALDVDATFSVPGAQQLDRLGFAAFGTHGHWTADVSGDGNLDLILVAQDVDAGGQNQSGAVYVFLGGNVSGSVAPIATLVDPAPRSGDRLGTDLFFHDVTGDGTLDLVVEARLKNLGTQNSAGALRIWEGGASLVGTPAPRAMPQDENPRTGAQFPRSLEIADVTGDGVEDIVAASPIARIDGVSFVGAVYIWPGGAGLSGSIPPTTLTLDPLLPSASVGEALRVGDVTGDGVFDVVTQWGFGLFASSAYKPEGTGLIWEGGPALTTPRPAVRFVLHATGPRSQGLAAYPQTLYVHDVSGDGTLDVLAHDQDARVRDTSQAGALLLWKGGSSLTSSRKATFLALAQPSTTDVMGSGEILFADHSLDGFLDVTLISPLADIHALNDGAAPLWLGPDFRATTTILPGPSPVPAGGSVGIQERLPQRPAGLLAEPAVVRAVPGASNNDQLGN